MPNSCVYHAARDFAHISAFSASKFKARVYSGFAEKTALALYYKNQNSAKFRLFVA